MDALTRGLTANIPLHEAADFFIKVKTAGWMDPPDEDGNLEGRFASPKEDVLKKLLEVAANKFKLFVAYHVYGETMKGPSQHAIGEQFREHAEHERAAAEYYLKRGSVLNGGPLNLPDDIKPPPPSTDPVQIMKRLIRAEQEAIFSQRELHKAVGSENPMRIRVEEIMSQDQHHLDELWQLLEPGADKRTQNSSDTKTASAVDAALRAAHAVQHPQAATGLRRAGQLLTGAHEGALRTAIKSRPNLGHKVEGLSDLMHEAQKVHTTRLAGGAALGVGLGASKTRGNEKTAGVAADIMDSFLAGKSPAPNKAGHFKLAAAKIKMAAGPMGFGDGTAGTQDGTPVMQETPAAQPQPQQQPALEQPPTLPVNYLGAEMAARENQQVNEANYYRERMQQAIQENQALQQQMQQTQMTFDQMQQQAATAGEQMQQVTQDAVAAQDRALTHSMEAARMRMGMQKMREQMLQVASQDPNTISPGMPGLSPDMTGAPVDVMSQGAGGMGAGMAPGAQPAPGAAPADAGMPAGAGGAEEAQPAATTPSASQTEKAGSLMARSLGALVGGGLGAYGGATAGNDVPGHEEQVAELEAQPGGFRHAVSLAKAKASLEIARASQAHPRAATISGGIGGALLGAQMGPAAANIVPRTMHNIGRVLNP